MNLSAQTWSCSVCMCMWIYQHKRGAPVCVSARDFYSTTGEVHTHSMEMTSLCVYCVCDKNLPTGEGVRLQIKFDIWVFQTRRPYSWRYFQPGSSPVGGSSTVGWCVFIQISPVGGFYKPTHTHTHTHTHSERVRVPYSFKDLNHEKKLYICR